MQALRKHFISNDQNFAERRSDAWLYFLAVGPILIFCLIASFYSTVYHDTVKEGRRARGLINGVTDGISHMEIQDLWIAAGAAIGVTLLIIFVVYSFQIPKKIVVGLQFDDEKKHLTLKCKNFREELFTDRIAYTDFVVLSDSEISDGMGRETFDVLIIQAKGEVIGYVFRNHFTWSPAEFEEIKKRLQ
jgi:hypothetical protein